MLPDWLSSPEQFANSPDVFLEKRWRRRELRFAVAGDYTQIVPPPS
jgi:hypothetical protein